METKNSLFGQQGQRKPRLETRTVLKPKCLQRVFEEVPSANKRRTLNSLHWIWFFMGKILGICSSWEPQGTRRWRSVAMVTMALGVVGCQNMIWDRPSQSHSGGTHSGSQMEGDTGSIEDIRAIDEGVQATPMEDSFVKKTAPKLGVILGGGGVLTLAQVGVLAELEKQKVPIHGIVGMEWGALIAGAYSRGGRVHDVEWQMLKMPYKSFLKKSLFGNKELVKIESFRPFLKSLSKNQTIRGGQVPFACPFLDLGKGTSQIVAKGSLQKALESCWPSMPEFQLSPKMASPMGYESAVAFLRQQGAELILYVDVIGENALFGGAQGRPDLGSQIYWLQAQNSLAGVLGYGIDEVMSLPVSGTRYNDYNAMRSVIRVGQLKGRTLVEEFVRKYGY